MLKRAIQYLLKLINYTYNSVIFNIYKMLSHD